MTQLSSAFIAEPGLIAALDKRAKPLTLLHDRVLFRQGDDPIGVFIVKKGKTLLTNRSEGDALFAAEAGTGSLLGLPAVIGTKPYTLTAEAMAGAELSVVPRQDFVELMQADPSLAFQVLQILAAEVRFARESLATL